LCGREGSDQGQEVERGEEERGKGVGKEKEVGDGGVIDIGVVVVAASVSAEQKFIRRRANRALGDGSDSWG
jgi:hypothetical protein